MKLIVSLGASYNAFETGFRPAWIDARSISIQGPLPEAFGGGDVLVAARTARGVSLDEQAWVYVGLLRSASIDPERRSLHFDYFDLRSPVRCGRAGDDYPNGLDQGQFAWISPDAFDRVLREGTRRIVRLEPNLSAALPGYAVEHRMTEDEVVNAALREYFDSHDWQC